MRGRPSSGGRLLSIPTCASCLPLQRLERPRVGGWGGAKHGSKRGQARPFSDRELTCQKGSFLPLPQEKQEGKQEHSEDRENPRYLFHTFIKQIFTEHLLFAIHHSNHEYSSEQDRQVPGAYTKILRSQGRKYLKSFQARCTPPTHPS